MALYHLKQKKAPEWLVSINGAQTLSPPLSPTAAAAAKKNLPAPALTSKAQGSREKKLSILSTLYPLNISRSKNITIGLYYNDTTQSFSPMVQLANADYSYNIYMDNATWSSMQNHFNDISAFFEAPNSARYPPSILVNSVQISFNHACGAKAVTFVDLSCPLTVRDLNKCGIIMQKKTFNGLMRASVCADERFRRIAAICTQVNKCKDYMREVVKTSIDSVHEDDEYLASLVYDLLIHSQGEETVKSIKQSFIDMQENVFINHYFDVVYLELALNPRIFISEIKCTRPFDK